MCPKGQKGQRDDSTNRHFGNWCLELNSYRHRCVTHAKVSLIARPRLLFTTSRCLASLPDPLEGPKIHTSHDDATPVQLLHEIQWQRLLVVQSNQPKSLQKQMFDSISPVTVVAMHKLCRTIQIRYAGCSSKVEVCRRTELSRQSIVVHIPVTAEDFPLELLGVLVPQLGSFPIER